MITLRGVRGSFGRFKLGPIDLSIPEGCYAVLLGPTGAGKSVLLQLIAGLRTPLSGEIELARRDVTRLPAERREIGMVFQRSALFPHMTVRENIEFGLRARGIAPARRRERSDALVENLALTPILDRPVATLSGGEAQKVAIARALAPGPRILLLDEPLAPIDAHARGRIRAELQRVHRQNALTTVHVTHSHEEARALGEFCVVLSDGMVAQQGATEAVYAEPASALVAEFLGGGPDPE